MLARIITFLIILVYTTGLLAQTTATDALWEKIHKSKNASEKSELFIRIADEYDLQNHLDQRDSVLDLALEDIHIRVQDSLVIKLYNWYFDKEEEYFTVSTSEYVRKLGELSRKRNDNKWHSFFYQAEAKNHLFNYNIRQALESASQAFYYASQCNDQELTVKAMLLMGYCLEKNNKKIEAFKKHTDALHLSRQLENKKLVYLAYQNLASFYYLIDNREKAKEYVAEQRSILFESTEMDSLQLVKLNINLITYQFDNNEKKQAQKLTREILDYSDRHEYKKLADRTLSIYRTYLINHNLLDELADLYTRQYPDALHEIEQSNPNLYFRLKAFICEAHGRLDSSEYYYMLAEENLKTTAKGDIYTSNFYKRYGEFLSRRGNIKEAEQKLVTAFNYAEKAQYIPYLTELSHALDSLAYAQGKTEEAYRYAKLNLQYNHEAEMAHQEEELLKLEVESEARERELMAEREQQATERRHNIQYMGLSILIVITFIILAMLGSLKMPKVVIKALGFFSFIFLFEFIIMLADHKIHHFTHGEPWKFMIFKIMLIAVLLPLHHWMEEKVIHYLVHHRMIDPSRLSIRKWLGGLFGKKAPTHDKEKTQEEKPTPPAPTPAPPTGT